MSGITAEVGIVEDFEKFKSKDKSKGNERRYIIYRISGENVVKAVEKPLGSDQEAQWAEFTKDLTAVRDDGAYAVFVLTYKTRDGREADGVLFVKWALDTLPVKKKMLYGSTLQSFKGELGGNFLHNLECSDVSDLDYDEVLKTLSTKK